MDNNTFEQIKAEWLSEARDGKACKDGYAEVLRAEDIGALCAVLKKHWSSFIALHCAKAFDWLERNYSNNKEAFNAHGVYYNEDSETGMVITNNTDGKTICVGGDAVCHAYGKSLIAASWHARVYAHHETEVKVTNNAQAQLFDTAKAYAYDRSRVDGNDTNIIYAYDACTINAGGSTIVYARSWNRIVTFGDAVVYAPTKRKIKGNVIISNTK